MTKTSSQDIVAAACELFRVRGYAGTSMKDLAEQVGIQKASLYNYVSSKADLVAQVLDLTMAQIFAQDAEPLDWRLAYESAVKRMASHMTEKRRCVALHLSYGIGDINDAAAKAVNRFFSDCREKFAAILAGGMPAEAAHDLATYTITLIEGATIWLATMADDGPMQRAVRELLARAEAASNEAFERKVKSVLDEVVDRRSRPTLAERVLARRLVEAEQRGMSRA